MGFSGGKETRDSLSSSASAKTRIEWKYKKLSEYSAIGLEGFCEFLEVDSAAESIAFFKSDQVILNGRAAATKRNLGRGVVVKLGFWPGDDGLLRLIEQFVPDHGSILAAPMPKGVVAIPHTDNSLFVVNTAGYEMDVQFARACTDRLSGATFESKAKLQPYQVWWLT